MSFTDLTEDKIVFELEEGNARDREKQHAEAVAKALAEHNQRQHDYKVVTLTKPTWCHECKRFMWGFANQGYHCAKCHEVVCAKCVLLEKQCPKSAASP